MRLDAEQPKDNFRRLEIFIDGNPVMKGNLIFRTIAFPAAGTSVPYAHGLGFKPVDFIFTSGSVTIASADDTNVYFSPTGAATVRLLMGKLEE